MNLELIKMILGSKHEYWLVWRENEYRDGCKFETGSPTTWVVSIPYSVQWRRGVEYHEMLVSEMDGLLNAEVHTNISISEDYPPFQLCIRFREFVGGVPIIGNAKEVVKMLLNMPKSEYHVYKSALKEFQEKAKDQSNDTI